MNKQPSATESEALAYAKLVLHEAKMGRFDAPKTLMLALELCRMNLRLIDAQVAAMKAQGKLASSETAAPPDRNAIIEECMDLCKKMDEVVDPEYRARSGYQFAAALRALKNEQAPQASGGGDGNLSVAVSTPAVAAPSCPRCGYPEAE